MSYTVRLGKGVDFSVRVVSLRLAKQRGHETMVLRLLDFTRTSWNPQILHRRDRIVAVPSWRRGRLKLHPFSSLPVQPINLFLDFLLRIIFKADPHRGQGDANVLSASFCADTIRQS